MNGEHQALDFLSQGYSIEHIKQHIENIYSTLTKIDDFLTAKWNWGDARKVWYAEGMEEVLELLNQGLSVEEIKKQLYSD